MMRTSLCSASQLAVEYYRRESGPAAICTDAKKYKYSYFRWQPLQKETTKALSKNL